MTHEELKQLETLLTKFIDTYSDYSLDDEHNYCVYAVEHISDVRMIDRYPKKEDSVRIEELDFTVRTYNTLKRANINTLSELREYQKVDFKGVMNLSTKSKMEIAEILSK